MNKKVKSILAAILAVLGFSSCTALREAREARAERERQALDARQSALVEEMLRKMEEEDREQGLDQPTLDEKTRREREAERIRREREQRAVLLYAVPNVPYQRIEKK